MLLDVQLWCTIEEWDCVVRYCCVVCGAYWWHWVVVSLCGTVGSCSVQSSRFCDGQGMDSAVCSDGQGMDRRQTRRAQTVTAGWTGPVILLKAQTVFLHCVFSNYLLAVCNRKTKSNLLF